MCLLSILSCVKKRYIDDLNNMYPRRTITNKGIIYECENSHVHVHVYHMNFDSVHI